MYSVEEQHNATFPGDARQWLYHQGIPPNAILYSMLRCAARLAWGQVKCNLPQLQNQARVISQTWLVSSDSGRRMREVLERSCIVLLSLCPGA